MDQVDPVPAIVVNGHALNENLVDAFSQQAITTLGVATDAEVAQLNPPQLLLGLRVILRPEQQRRFAFLILVDKMSRRARTFQPGVLSMHMQWLG